MLPATINNKDMMLLEQKEHITREQHYNVIEACNNHWQQKINRKKETSGKFLQMEYLRDRDSFLLLTLWNMGARVGDVTLIDVDAINTYQKDMVYFVNKLSEKDKKTKQVKKPVYHKIFLEDSYIIAFQNYIKKWNIDKYLFISYSDLNKPKEEKKPITTRQVNHLCHKYGAMVGIPELHPHMYRHSIAIHMRDNHVPFEIISKHLGHRSVETTVKFYAKISHEVVRKFVQSKTSIN